MVFIMKKLILMAVVLGLVGGCGKSQEEIALEKKSKIEAQIKADKAVDLKKVEDAVKYVLKDGESARFRNVIGNCGEVNSKNSYGAYAGFSRFVFKRDNGKVVFDNPDNQYFNAVVASFCDEAYLEKFPVVNSSNNTSPAAPVDAAPIDN